MQGLDYNFYLIFLFYFQVYFKRQLITNRLIKIILIIIMFFVCSYKAKLFMIQKNNILYLTLVKVEKFLHHNILIYKLMNLLFFLMLQKNLIFFHNLLVQRNLLKQVHNIFLKIQAIYLNLINFRKFLIYFCKYFY